MADYDSMGWLNDPVTVRPEDYLPQMVAVDAAPGDARKRARSKLDYARKLHQFVPAPPPFPPGHVFTDSFLPGFSRNIRASRAFTPTMDENR